MKNCPQTQAKTDLEFYAIRWTEKTISVRGHAFTEIE
jgi:hypothetical protein